MKLSMEIVQIAVKSPSEGGEDTKPPSDNTSEKVL